MDYLAELIREKNLLSAFPNYFKHTERLVDIELTRIRTSFFQCNFNDDIPKLPDPDTQEDKVTLQEKVYVPVKDHPDFNFVGRILGPRGMTAKQLEHETGCKIMVRGRGSMRDEVKEEMHRGKPNWEHLDDDLHILIQCEDADKRARAKLQNAVSQVKKLLIPAPGGIDELKRKQLMELSIINGTYRPNSQKVNRSNASRLMPLSLLSPARPSNTSPIYHHSVPSNAFFGSPLPSPVNYRPISATNHQSFEFNDLIKHINTQHSALDDHHQDFSSGGGGRGSSVALKHHHNNHQQQQQQIHHHYSQQSKYSPVNLPSLTSTPSANSNHHSAGRHTSVNNNNTNTAVDIISAFGGLALPPSSTLNAKPVLGIGTSGSNACTDDGSSFRIGGGSTTQCNYIVDVGVSRPKAVEGGRPIEGMPVASV